MFDLKSLKLAVVSILILPVISLATTSAADVKKIAEEAKSNIAEKNSTDDLSSLSQADLIARAKNVGDHGWAVLDRVKNDTDFPVSIYFYKTLHDLLPMETHVRIKSLKKDYFTQAVDKDGKTNADAKNFRYLAARKKSGNWVLSADTTDANDPATTFIIRKYLAQDLSSYLGFEAALAPGQLLRAKSSNQAIFSKSTTQDSVMKAGGYSSDNFSSDFDSDAHWELHCNGTGVNDPIDDTDGTYLNYCGLKNKLGGGYLSIRDQTDLVNTNKTAIPSERFIYYPKKTTGSNNHNFWDKVWRASKAGNDLYIQFHFAWFKKNAAILSKDEINSAVKFFLKNGAFSFDNVYNLIDSLKNSGERISPDIWTSRLLGNWIVTASDSDGDAERRMKEVNYYYSDGISENFEFRSKYTIFDGISLASQAKNYNDKSLLDNVFEAVVGNNEKSILKNNFKKDLGKVCYGDKILLVSTKSLSYLFGFNINKSVDGDSKKYAYAGGSHLETSIEKAKLQRTTGKESDEDLLSFAWFYVKGPHDNVDSWNCQIGEPVKDGDVIRLENVATGRNLTVLKQQKPPRGELRYGVYAGPGANLSNLSQLPSATASLKNASKKADSEFDVALSESTSGINSSDDNFVVRFEEQASSELKICGQFSLIHQNSKYSLWMDNVFSSVGDKDKFARVSAIFADQDIKCPWFAAAVETGSLPTKDIAWIGAPNGAPQTSFGDKEELSIEIIKMGLSGGLGAGETIAVQLPAYKKNPKISGFAKDEISEFGVEKIVELMPMLDKGIAWLEESISKENKATIKFRAKANDSGNVCIYLGNDLTLDWIYKVVIGSDSNSSCKIYRRDTSGGIATDIVIAEVSKKDNPLAAAIPGQYIPYWVSYNNGMLMAGASTEPGENMFICVKEKNQRNNVSRFGFGSGKQSVSYAEVKVADAVSIDLPGTPYFDAQGKNLKVDEQGNINIDESFDIAAKNLMFKIPGSGTLQASISSKDGAFYFYEGQNFDEKTSKHYRLKFNSFSQLESIIKDKINSTTQACVNYLKKIEAAKKNKEFNADQEESVLYEILNKKSSSFASSNQEDADLLDLKTLNNWVVTQILSNFNDFLKNALDQLIVKTEIPRQVLQNKSKNALSCLIFEKYNPQTQQYEFLANSASLDASVKFNFEKGQQIWASFCKDKFFFGFDNFSSDNIAFYCWDLNGPHDNIQNILYKPTASSDLSNVQLSNKAVIKIEQSAQDYSTSSSAFDYKGSLQVILPYIYALSQEEQQVKFKDMISKKTIYPGKTPQQGALYYFTLSLRKNGFPELVWTKEPENKLALEIQKQTLITQAKSDALFQASTYVQGGMSAIGGLTGAIASGIFAGEGISQANKAAQLSATSQTAFRSNDSYVYTDSMTSMGQLAKESIPPQIAQNKQTVSDQLALGGKVSAIDVEKLQRLVPLYDNVLNLIIHPYVITGLKDDLFSKLNALYRGYTTLNDASAKINAFDFTVFDLFAKAYNNSYLVDKNVSTERVQKQNWYSYINDMAKRFFNSNQSFPIPPMFGEYIWLDQSFEKPNKGSVSFMAKGQNDLFVCISDEPVSVRNSDKDIYEVVFGAWDNNKTVIRAKSLDKQVSETTLSSSLLNSVQFKKYWVSFNSGNIILGTGDIDPANALASYDSSSKSFKKPVWETRATSGNSTTSINQQWIDLAIGREKDENGDPDPGKDILLELRKDSKYADFSDFLDTTIAEKTDKINALIKSGTQPYSSGLQQTDSGKYADNAKPFGWQDPYFNKKSEYSYVGFGSWDAPVEIKSVVVGPCIEEVSGQKQNLVAIANHMKNLPIFSDSEVGDLKNKIITAFKAKIDEINAQSSNPAAS